MIEGRIGPLDLSAPEVSGGEVELSETDQDDTRTLNLPIQKASREKTSVRIKPKRSWFESYQKVISRLEEHMDQDDAKSLNLPVQKASEEQTRIERKRKMSRENTTHTSEKRFKCKISKKDFAAPSNLRTHMRTRTGKKPIECKICGKIFTTTSSLREHMRIHNGEKPFSCSECNMSFTQSSTLREHMSIHNGEKPFACSECNMSFTQCTFSGVF
ncbi:zinc finger protein [Loa loa]|uniref:Zinc finger protein n=1 Tax=Loa loa TaxID=7209 RepID=A0A1I7W3G7_LOALO|nr:zinc finger protein [Loa loa]EJD73514.1 zinc finger protein [Loa loa]